MLRPSTADLEKMLDVIALAATDHVISLALDRDSVRDIDRDGRMRVTSANISKATVNPYKGHEIPDWEALGLDPNKVYQLYRDPEELAKAAPTFNGVQLLRKHIPVNAEDHQPWDVVGSTGTEASFEAPYLRNSLSIWAKDAIDEIESEAKRELSCGYHYRADMTPGEFDGMRFDGVMRDIVGNHVALVKDGRAGPDVVVGDSNEEIMSANRELAKTIAAIAARTVSIQALSTFLKPRLAMDAKISLAKAFDGVTGATFKDSIPKIAASIKDQAKGKMAKDTSLEDVEKVLGMLEKHEVDGGDASVSEPQHNAMEAAANGNSELDIPKKVGEEFVTKDAGREALSGFLKEKGFGDEDIGAACDMAFPVAAVDEDPDEAKKKKDQEEADKKAAADKAAKDAEMKDADKDKVTKPAMDAALAEAKREVRETERGIRSALSDIRPFVGELPASLAFDSADDVYRHAAVMLNIPEAKTIHASALPTLVRMQPKAGARPSNGPVLGMDAAQAKSFAERFPDAGRITPA